MEREGGREREGEREGEGEGKRERECILERALHANLFLLLMFLAANG